MKNHFEFILKATGVVTSPNHPDNYPDTLDKTQTIEVESGKRLRLEFTSFAVHACDIPTCPCDFVKITDGDGTTLMDNSCGYSEYPSSSWYFLPPIITTRSNRVEIFFHTDGTVTSSGWSLSWSAVTPGECQQCNLVNLLLAPLCGDLIVKLFRDNSPIQSHPLVALSVPNWSNCSILIKTRPDQTFSVLLSTSRYF